MLNHPEIVELLKTRFVPMGLDNVENPQLTPAEKAFLKERGGEFSTQGMSIFTAGGTLLGMGGGFQAEPVLEMMKEALTKFGAWADASAEPTPEQIEEATKEERRQWTRTPPEGGLVLYVTWAVLDGVERTESSPTTGDGHYDDEFRRSVGVDRLWVRKDEAEALARGEVAESLRRRMAFHVSYAVVGDVTESELEVDMAGGAIEGSFLSDKGARAEAAGVIETAEGRVTKLELLVTGRGERVEDCGFPASLTIIPKGTTVPVGVFFELADPEDNLAKVPPHRSRGETYLN